MEARGADPLALAAAGDASEGPVSVLLKDESACVRCGLCAERCPTGAMTMERRDWKVAETGAEVGAAAGMSVSDAGPPRRVAPCSR